MVFNRVGLDVVALPGPDVTPLGPTWWTSERNCEGPTTSLRLSVEDEINVPIALSAFTDKGSRLWSLKKKKKKLS